jgi:8-oxo-dGTP diphosphatase
MWDWAKQQADAEASGRRVERKMFLPIVNLYRDFPELEHALEGR